MKAAFSQPNSRYVLTVTAGTATWAMRIVRGSVKSPRRQLRCLSAVLGGAALVAAASGPPLDSNIGHAVQLAHWQAFYEAGVPAATTPRPLEGIDLGNDALPSLREKYDRTPAAPGMDRMVATEFARLRTMLPAPQKQGMAGWKPNIGRCTTSGIALLTAADPRRKSLCIAPILVTSLYLESSGSRTIQLLQYLRTNGVSPSTFDGAYDRRLNQRGITPADWTSVLSSFAEPTWSVMRQSIDLVLARAMLCGALKTADCGRDAARLVRSMDSTASASSLVAALQSASSTYDPSSWGYEVSGDGNAVLSALQSPSPDR